LHSLCVIGDGALFGIIGSAVCLYSAHVISINIYPKIVRSRWNSGWRLTEFTLEELMVSRLMLTRKGL